MQAENLSPMQSLFPPGLGWEGWWREAPEPEPLRDVDTEPEDADLDPRLDDEVELWGVEIDFPPRTEV